MNPALLDFWRMSEEQAPVTYGNPKYGGDYTVPGTMTPTPMGFISEEQAQAGGKQQPIAPRSEPALGNAAKDVTTNKDPIQSGAQNALESTRASLAMTEQQRREALGEAIMGFFGNVASSKNPTVLGSLAESMPAGLQAWKAAEAEAKALNLASLNRQDMLENRDWMRDYYNRELALKEKKANASGGLKPGNQIALSTAHSNAVIARQNAYTERLNALVGSFAPQQRTPELIKQLEGIANQEMAAYDKAIQNIKNTGLSLGWDVENNIPITDISAYLPTQPGQVGQPGQAKAQVIASDGTVMNELDEDKLFEIAGYGGV